MAGPCRFFAFNTLQTYADSEVASHRDYHQIEGARTVTHPTNAEGRHRAELRANLPQRAVDRISCQRYSFDLIAMNNVTSIYVAVVDDDESVCRSFVRLLRAAGMQPISYLSAEAFLADTKRPQFGCLLLDIQLGGMSGIELAQRLVAENRRTPVVFITAHDDPEVRASAEAAGCAAYFRKTDSGKEVLEAIRRAAA
jgi:CheY-like chemotaxis protein